MRALLVICSISLSLNVTKVEAEDSYKILSPGVKCTSTEPVSVYQNPAEDPKNWKADQPITKPLADQTNAPQPPRTVTKKKHHWLARTAFGASGSGDPIQDQLDHQQRQINFIRTQQIINNSFQQFRK